VGDDWGEVVEEKEEVKKGREGQKKRDKE